MSIQSYSTPTPALTGSVSQVAGGLRPIRSTWVGRLGLGLGLGLRRRRQRQALAQLDERLLADLGLTRTQVAKETAKPFWR
jgi:hypothetical protein